MLNSISRKLGRLLRQNPNSPDYNVQRNYLDFFTDLPWATYSKDIFDPEESTKSSGQSSFWTGGHQEKNTGTHGCSEAEKRHEISYFMSCRPSGSW